MLKKYIAFRIKGKKRVCETFFKQQPETSCSQALNLMMNLIHHDLCWKGPAGQGVQQSSDDNTAQSFLTHCEADEWGDSAEPQAYSAGPREVWQKPWWHWLPEGKSQDYERKPKSSPRLQENRLGVFRDLGLVLSSLKISKAGDSLSIIFLVNVFSHLPLYCLLSFYGAAAGSSCLCPSAKLLSLNCWSWFICHGQPCTHSFLFHWPELSCGVLFSSVNISVLQVKVVIRLLRRGKSERNKGAAGAIFSLSFWN